MIKHLLFETRWGEWLLARIEALLGLGMDDDVADCKIAETARVIHTR